MNKQHFNAAVEFGKTLLHTQDLDPVYVALWSTENYQNKPRLKRTVLAYTCLYHLGAAACIGALVGDYFWDELSEAARNVGLVWPRGSERRHWRGQQAINSVAYLKANFHTPEDVLDYWLVGDTFKQVSERVQEAVGFGPWIAFKVADLCERVFSDCDISFEDCALEMYSEPRKGAALLMHGDAEAPMTKQELDKVVLELNTVLRHEKAPPRFDRTVNIQEMETILCKYKSHVHGHYPPGKDTHEVLLALGTAKWRRFTKNLKPRIVTLAKQWERN